MRVVRMGWLRKGRGRGDLGAVLTIREVFALS